MVIGDRILQILLPLSFTVRESVRQGDDSFCMCLELCKALYKCIILFHCHTNFKNWCFINLSS
jgi:hypothetical protein